MLETIIEFAREYYEIFLVAHIIALAAGLGAANVTDVLFFKFLKDLKITKEEASTLSSLSQIIWVALVFIVISGLALYAPQAARLNGSPAFLVKMISFAVIIVNGISLNFLIAPRLEQIFSGNAAMLIPRYWRRLAFASGAISITSWYSTAILGGYRSISADFGTILNWYLTVLLIAIVASQIAEMLFAKRKI